MIKSSLISISVILMSVLFSCSTKDNNNEEKQSKDGILGEVKQVEANRLKPRADSLLSAEVITVTDSKSSRSSGDEHEFYSEGDYWWPDPDNPGGPYKRRDGMTNPDNFTAHRKAMRRISILVPELVSLYLIAGNDAYADAAIKHVNAWFVDKDTYMKPHMLYSQAISGRVTGRGIGIIDAIHLVEVVKAIQVLEEENQIKEENLEDIKAWFAEFNEWITTHPYGAVERHNGNNHSTCWAMQVATYAKLTENDSLMNAMREFYKNTIVPGQLADDGTFPRELARTKPYGYALFNLDAMTTLCQVASTEKDSLWEYVYNDSLNIKEAVDYMLPYIKDKSKWPYPDDVMYHEYWPMRHNALLFAYMAYGDEEYYEVWKSLKPESDVDEVNRNFFIRAPLLWLNN